MESDLTFAVVAVCILFVLPVLYIKLLDYVCKSAKMENRTDDFIKLKTWDRKNEEDSK